MMHTFLLEPIPTGVKFDSTAMFDQPTCSLTGFLSRVYNLYEVYNISRSKSDRKYLTVEPNFTALKMSHTKSQALYYFFKRFERK